MQDIDTLYNNSKNIYSDISQHVPTLKNYASQVSSIAEFGVRGTNNSTHAFIKGLIESTSDKKSYIGVDIKPVTINYMEDIAKHYNIDFKFIVADSAKVDIPEVDILFIDSWHVYAHLKRELAKHHSIVKKYIIMHDTTVDEWVGETIRNKWDSKQQSIDTGYPEEEINKGLWPAIEEFLKEHPEWVLKERFTNNNGLTVLSRV